eukprot:scaffold12312_cov248-Ochromonas_danica.AAC.5
MSENEISLSTGSSLLGAAAGGGGGGGAHGGSLVRVDTAALVNIVRDLEHQMNESQRQDKPPIWATALEQRLEQLEKWRSSSTWSVPSGGSGGSGGVGEGKSSGGTTGSGGGGGGGGGSVGLSEEKVLIKVRSEMEAALADSPHTRGFTTIDTFTSSI